MRVRNRENLLLSVVGKENIALRGKLICLIIFISSLIWYKWKGEKRGGCHVTE